MPGHEHNWAHFDVVEDWSVEHRDMESYATLVSALLEGYSSLGADSWRDGALSAVEMYRSASLLHLTVRQPPLPTHQIQALHVAREIDRQRITTLEARVESLEQRLTDLLGVETEEGQTDGRGPHATWAAAHPGLLREWTGQWVAVNADRGIIAHGALAEVHAAVIRLHLQGDAHVLFVEPSDGVPER